MDKPQNQESKINLMLVDDKEISNFILRKNIEKYFPGNASIFEFCNGEEAFQAIPSIDPSLIFLDLGLPNFEDGFEFLAKMENQKLPHRIAIVSSSVNEEHHSLVQDHPNVISFISKPISTDELMQTMALALT